MANRTLYRTIILQTLYEWDIRGYNNQNIESIFEYVLNSFNDTALTQDIPEMSEVIHAVTKKRVILDDIIQNAAPEWTLDKIAIVDRNILRLGLYELLFGNHEKIPHKVAINEAVELAKRFGGPKSHKFINGVIGAVYREIGEPGKGDQTPSKMPDIPYEEMPIDQKGSAVVYSIDDTGIVRLGMVHDIFGYWTLAKGSIEEGETLEEGTIREVKEETNWDVELIQKLGDNEYIAYHPERGPVRKQVTYFLGKAPYVVPTLGNDSGGLDDVRWFELSDIAELTMYEDVSQMIIKSIELISSSQ